MVNLKNLGQELSKQQQQQVFGGARQLCFSCVVAGYVPTELDPDLPLCDDCIGYGQAE